jgi:nucleoid DNA-binding protein
MNLAHLVDDVTGRTELRRADVDKIVKATFDSIAHTVSNGEEVRISNFGTFRRISNPPRERRNPITGVRYLSGILYVPRFSATGKFRRLIKQGLPVDTIAKDPKSY